MFFEKIITTGIIFGLISMIGWGVGSAIAYISYSLGVEKHYLAIIAPIAAAFPLITILLAMSILKEKISFTQLIGITFIMTGIITLSIL